ncbi:MAG: metallophosphoesterase [Fimbriimonadaceae bacterium]|nr:metallophosphoesterase [Fimbriimonadaceae bacterium]
MKPVNGMGPEERIERPAPRAVLSRRAFLQAGSLFLAGAASGAAWGRLGRRSVAKVGILADLHHADKMEAGGRYYRMALPKLREAFRLQAREGLDRIVHLGDLVDSVKDVDQEEIAIQTVANEFRAFGTPYHFLMGNHCLSAVDKCRYRDLTSTAGRHEHFDVGGVRFLCLDACFRSDARPYARGNFDWRDAAIPFPQRAWLRHELRDAPGPCVVLVHQLLDPVPNYCVSNHEEVRNILARSGKVLAVIQGHYHQNRYTEIDGIPYIVLRSLIEGPNVTDRGSSVLQVFDDGSAVLKGFSLQHSYALNR